MQEKNDSGLDDTLLLNQFISLLEAIKVKDDPALIEQCRMAWDVVLETQLEVYPHVSSSSSFGDSNNIELTPQYFDDAPDANSPAYIPFAQQRTNNANLLQMSPILSLNSSYEQEDDAEKSVFVKDLTDEPRSDSKKRKREEMQKKNTSMRIEKEAGNEEIAIEKKSAKKRKKISKPRLPKIKLVRQWNHDSQLKIHLEKLKTKEYLAKQQDCLELHRHNNKLLPHDAISAIAKKIRPAAVGRANDYLKKQKALGEHYSYAFTKAKPEFPLSERLDIYKNIEERMKFLREHVMNLIRYDLHLMSEFPNSTTPYKNSYLFIKSENSQQLYYVKPDGNYKEVKSFDFDSFTVQLTAINKEDADILHLSYEQVYEMIIAKGGYSPSPIDGKQLSLAAQNLLFLYSHHLLYSLMLGRRSGVACAQVIINDLKRINAIKLTSREALNLQSALTFFYSRSTRLKNCKQLLDNADLLIKQHLKSIPSEPNENAGLFVFQKEGNIQQIHVVHKKRLVSKGALAIGTFVDNPLEHSLLVTEAADIIDEQGRLIGCYRPGVLTQYISVPLRKALSRVTKEHLKRDGDVSSVETKDENSRSNIKTATFGILGKKKKK